MKHITEEEAVSLLRGKKIASSRRKAEKELSPKKELLGALWELIVGLTKLPVAIVAIVFIMMVMFPISLIVLAMLMVYLPFWLLGKMVRK